MHVGGLQLCQLFQPPDDAGPDPLPECYQAMLACRGRRAAWQPGTVTRSASAHALIIPGRARPRRCSPRPHRRTAPYSPASSRTDRSPTASAAVCAPARAWRRRRDPLGRHAQPVGQCGGEPRNRRRRNQHVDLAEVEPCWPAPGRERSIRRTQPPSRGRTARTPRTLRPGREPRPDVVPPCHTARKQPANSGNVTKHRERHCQLEVVWTFR